MNNARKAVASLMLASLVFASLAMSGFSQKRTAPEAPAPAREEPSARQQLDVGEKLVRDVYARLMRYQSAARDEAAARQGQSSTPDDYLTFELRHLRSGEIEDIANLSLSEMVTPRSGAVLKIVPNHLSNRDGVFHAYYDTQWTNAPVEATAGASTLRDMLRKGNIEATKYVSYDVTVRLQNQKRTYSAMLLYRTLNEDSLIAAQRSTEPTSVEILDNVASVMNVVYKDQSPPVQAPWSTYIRSNRYRAVVTEIRNVTAAGRKLIPWDAPIGYLPGDNVSFTTAEATTSCPDLRILRDAVDITDTTVSVVVGERISLSLESNPLGDDPTDIQWSIGGNRIANFVVNGTGPTGASTGTVTQLTNLSTPDIVFYWINAGQGFDVSVTASVFGAILTKHAYFNVVAPSNATPTVTLPTNGQLNINNLTDCSGGQPAPSMVFGNISGANPGCTYSGQAGIIFTPPTTNNPTGTFFFVQLVTGDNITYSRTGATLTCTATNTPGLDGRYPYQGVQAQAVNDAPFNPLPSTYTNSTRQFAATMYLMWQSNTTNSIPVPMGSVAWSFSGETSQPAPNTNSWSTPTGSGSAQTFVPASGASSYPQWSALLGHANSNCH